MTAGNKPQRRGPLAGLRIVEFAGLGPAPFATMLLADLGADVLLIDRPGQGADPRDVVWRGRRSLEMNLKQPEAVETCLAAIARADVLIEGFRPGVMERLGLGPDVAQARNPRLIYARMTGWGQDGPLAQAAGHDINYIALTGALAAIGAPDGAPAPPLNLVGDFGGGALYLALGIGAALYERERSGLGQVIDAAIVDGTASLMNFFNGITATGLTRMNRAENILGGQAPFYGCYGCADGKYISVGPIEPHFHKTLLTLLGVDAAQLAGRDDPANWEQGRAILAAAFASRPRHEWLDVLEGTDACVAPVLELDEAPTHPHMRARNIYFERDGVMQAAAAPRFSRTPGDAGDMPAASGEPGLQLLAEWGVAPR